MEIKDLLAAAALVLGALYFAIKLRADATAARYRETIAFLDKNSEKVKGWWKTIEGHAHKKTAIEEIIEPVSDLLGILDTTALLIEKKALDSELIYNYWWKFFVRPMENETIKIWVDGLRRKDRAKLEHYCKQQAIWAARVIKEESEGLEGKSKGINQPDNKPVSLPIEIENATAPDSSSPLGLVDSPETATLAEPKSLSSSK